VRYEVQVVDILRRVPLFSKLPEDKLAWIAGQGEKIWLEPKTTFAMQGAPPDGFYVVLEGQTEWTRKIGGQDVFVEKLGNGSIFADLLLILDAPYPTTGRAIKQVRLFKLDVASFWEMLCVCPEVLRGILAPFVERAELHESVSQQHANLISLGTMAAGLAHELNNPAAAVGRSAEEASEVFRESSVRALKLGELEMSLAERAFVAGLATEVAERLGSTLTLNSLERSDLEDEVALWLEDRGVEEAWELSLTIVGAGLDTDWLEELTHRLSDEDALGDVLAWLVTDVNGEVLLIQLASARISELVGQ
jgi:CRP-like cAMP-binding protein